MAPLLARRRRANTLKQFTYLQKMEPEVVAFLKRVGLSMSIAFFWLSINTIVGIKFNLAFIDTKMTVGNVIFYVWMVGSFLGMLWFFVRLWRESFKPKE